MKSWKEKFYPINASEAVATDEMATMHSLKKWEGLLPENVQAHGLYLDGECLHTGGIFVGFVGSKFFIDKKSCALCQKNMFAYNINCDTCAINKHMGVTCDSEIDDESLLCSHESPYNQLVDNNDPKPMIRLLKATLEKIRAEKKE
jgi:hypothetical protein